jgi:hypothetical protein
MSASATVPRTSCCRDLASSCEGERAKNGTPDCIHHVWPSKTLTTSVARTSPGPDAPGRVPLPAGSCPQVRMTIGPWCKQQLAKLLVYRHQPIPLGNRRIALGNGLQRQRAQCINIFGKRSSRSVHAQSTAHHRRFASAELAPNSLYRRQLPGFRRNHAPRMDAHPI